MKDRADISFIEVEVPQDHQCSSGHKAPEFFKRGGPESDSEPIKFFRVKGQGTDIVICEPCLILANYLAKIQRQTKR